MKVHDYYATGRTAATVARFQFKPGPTPETIALREEGRKVASSYAPFEQMEYLLVDGRTWWATLATGTKLANLGLTMGEPFKVCKREISPNLSVTDVRRISPDEAEGATTMKETVRLNGKPQEITLAYPTGKPGQSDFGPYVKYSLADDKLVFAELALDEVIQGLRPPVRAGERLWIQQRKDKSWDVRRLDSPASGPELVAPARQQVTEQRNDGPTRTQANGITDGFSKDELKAALGTLLANGLPEPKAAPTPKPAPAALMTGSGQHTLRYYTEAVDLASAIEKYAATCGLSIRADFEDIRCIATVSRINAEKGGR